MRSARVKAALAFGSRGGSKHIFVLPDMKARMEAAGLEVIGGTQAHVREVLVQDIEKWKGVVKAADIKL